MTVKKILISVDKFGVRGFTDQCSIDDVIREFRPLQVFAVGSPQWCILPDLLLAEGGTALVGLSFGVRRGSERIAESMVGGGARYFSPENVRSQQRYSTQTGNMARLELLWAESRSGLQCEVASIYYGSWLARETISGIKYVGYWLPMLDEIVEDFGKVFTADVHNVPLFATP